MRSPKLGQSPAHLMRKLSFLSVVPSCRTGDRRYGCPQHNSDVFVFDVLAGVIGNFALPTYFAFS